MFDLILKGGWVIDGSGGPAFRADVGLLETMIAEVGRLDGAVAPKSLTSKVATLFPGSSTRTSTATSCSWLIRFTRRHCAKA